MTMLRRGEGEACLPKAAARFVDESFFVRANVRVLDTGKDADLIEGVLLFLVRKFDHFDFLESVDISVS